MSVQAHDDLRNKRLCGGDTFLVHLSGGPQEVHADITDTDDGMYTATYSTTRAGQYQLHISDGELDQHNAVLAATSIPVQLAHHLQNVWHLYAL